MKVLLVPGWAMSSRCWDDFRTHSDSRVGFSAMDWGELASADDIPSKVGTFVRAEGPGHILCGWSMGAMAAIQSVSEADLDICGLVLISACMSFVNRPGHVSGWDGRVLDRMSAQLTTDRQALLSEFCRRIAESGGGDASLSGKLESCVDRDVSAVTLQSGLDYLGRTDLRTQVRKLDLPVLLIHGRDDRTIPLESADVLRLSLQSMPECAIFDGAGHIPQISFPGECARAVAGFMGKL